MSICVGCLFPVVLWGSSTLLYPPLFASINRYFKPNAVATSGGARPSALVIGFAHSGRKTSAEWQNNWTPLLEDTAVPHLRTTSEPARLCADRASTGCCMDQDGGVDGAGANEDSPEHVPPIRRDVRSVPGGRAVEGAGGKGVLVQASEKVPPSQQERWLSMTKTEKRRLWLHRRRSGEFYFRSEFKGLVHAVCKRELKWCPTWKHLVPAT